MFFAAVIFFLCERIVEKDVYVRPKDYVFNVFDKDYVFACVCYEPVKIIVCLQRCLQVPRNESGLLISEHIFKPLYGTAVDAVFARKAYA